MSTRGSDKASRYIEQLKAARLSGSSSDVKEFARKVAKHAPNQRGLVLIANTEADFPCGTTLSRSKGNEEKLSQAASNLRDFLNANEKQDGILSLDARATLACALLSLEQWEEVTKVVSVDYWRPVLEQGKTTIAPLVALSLLKCVYCLGSAQMQLGASPAADDTFQIGLQFIKGSTKLISQHRELSRLAQRISTQSSLIVGSPSAGGPTIEGLNRDIVKYRSWAQYSKAPSNDTANSQSTTAIWKAYYTLVSDILRTNIAYTGPEQAPLATWQPSLSRHKLSSARVKQYTELQNVERAYEQVLGRTTTFPAAHEANTTYESFADQAVANWNIIMSSEWRDTDLGKGGKLDYSRKVLEVLYRASSKTFHSTSVLRHLFTVHAQLGEFDLASKAFDSYNEIVSKGKSRAEKTGKDETGLDSDDVLLYTAAEAVNVLCLYGERNEAERAFEIGDLLSSWVKSRRPRASSNASGDLDSAAVHDAAEAGPTPSARAAAYRAIGQSQATWARYAYESTTRKGLQQDAIKNLRHSQTLSGPAGTDLGTAYLLAYSLAENRQPSAAISVAKRALASQQIQGLSRTMPNEVEESFDNIRRRLSLWHLLVLILSAMSEYDAALSTCEAALDLLIIAARKCDSADGLVSDDSVQGLPIRLVDGLGDAEKETFIQLKMTELELLVLTDNLAYGSAKHKALVITYKELFGDPGAAAPAKEIKVGRTTVPPSRAGTVKSFRHSIFGRPKTGRKSLDNTTFEKPPPLPSAVPAASTEPERTMSINPPSVTVTDTDGVNGADERTNGGTRSSLSIRRGRAGVEKVPDAEPVIDLAAPVDGANSQGLETSAAAVNEKQTPLEAEAILHMTPPSSVPARPSAPFFASLARTRHHLTLLVSIWLSLSKHYLTDSPPDALAAVEEAQRLVKVLQSATAPVNPSGAAWLVRGWGLGSSIAQLQADVLAQQGVIAHLTQGPHAALKLWEKALLWAPDHEVALPGLAGVLLDMHEGTVALDAPSATAPETPDDEQDVLTRLACRDRAYMLCSTATKGPLWDKPEAWFLLGRSWDVVEHKDKAAECYWWVVELEDSEPVRSWRCAGFGP